MEDLTSTVSVEPIFHEVIAPHYGAAIGGPTDRRPKESFWSSEALAGADIR